MCLESSDTIATIKDKLVDKKLVNRDGYRLIFNSRRLEDGRTLRSYRIKHASQIRLLRNMEGGGKRRMPCKENTTPNISTDVTNLAKRTKLEPGEGMSIGEAEQDPIDEARRAPPNILALSAPESGGVAETAAEAEKIQERAKIWADLHRGSANKFMVPDPSATAYLAGDRVVRELGPSNEWKDSMCAIFQSNAWKSAPNAHAVAHLTSVAVVGFNTAQGSALAQFVLERILPLQQAGRPLKAVLLARTLGQFCWDDIQNKKTPDSPDAFAAAESKQFQNVLNMKHRTRANVLRNHLRESSQSGSQMEGTETLFMSVAGRAYNTVFSKFSAVAVRSDEGARFQYVRVDDYYRTRVQGKAGNKMDVAAELLQLQGYRELLTDEVHDVIDGSLVAADGELPHRSKTAAYQPLIPMGEPGRWLRDAGRADFYGIPGQGLASPHMQAHLVLIDQVGRTTSLWVSVQTGMKSNESALKENLHALAGYVGGMVERFTPMGAYSM